MLLESPYAREPDRSPTSTSPAAIAASGAFSLAPGDAVGQAFLTMFDAAPTALIIVGPEGRILGANRQALATFGFGAEALQGASVEMLIPTRYRDRHQRERGAYQQNPVLREMGRGRDLTALHADGREFPVEVGLNPLYWRGQRLVVASIIDLTARNRLQLNLLEAKERLEEFCRVASHDLKSPLCGVVSLLEWMEDDLQSGRSADLGTHLTRIRTRVQRLKRLIDELLAYASAADHRHAPGRLEPRELISDVVHLSHPPAHIQVLVDVPPGAIEAARTPLQTVLLNLLGNAYKHHDQPSGVVEIEVRQVGSFCEFAVRDNGPGIPEEALARVFRLFQTLGTTSPDNHGIGLAVVKRLVHAHGGRIMLENNTPERGLTARVWWPRVRRAEYDREQT